MLSDEMHDGLFQHRSGQPPAGEVLLATVLDEAPGDVVAEPLPVFLFGVARRQPVAGLVEELACQWGTVDAALRRASPWFGCAFYLFIRRAHPRKCLEAKWYL